MRLHHFSFYFIKYKKLITSFQYWEKFHKVYKPNPQDIP